MKIEVLPQGALLHQVLPDGTEIGQDDGRLDLLTKWIHEHRPLFEGKAILDLGSNVGHFPIEYARAGARSVVAVEGRPEFVEIFYTLWDKVGLGGPIPLYINGDLRNVPFNREAGEIHVLSFLGICYHLSHVWSYLANLLRHIRPETVLIESQLWTEDRWVTENPSEDRSKSLYIEQVHRPTKEAVEVELGKLGLDYEWQELGGLYEMGFRGCRGFWVCKPKEGT